jgi:hypothetical protein
MLWKRILVRDQERVLIARNGRFRRILAGGKHVVFAIPGVSLSIERYDTTGLIFRSSWTSYLLRERPDVIAEHFTVIETNDAQLGMVYANGKLATVLLPEQRVLFWRGVAEITVELVDIGGDTDSLSDEDELDGVFDNIPAGVD